MEKIGWERRVGELPFYVKQWIDCEEQVKSLWIRIRDRTNKGHLVVRICYSPPDQGKSADEAFFL